jgi:signal transduction histidine kinase/DNA-binding response OmpR family regulator
MPLRKVSRSGLGGRGLALALMAVSIVGAASSFVMTARYQDALSRNRDLDIALERHLSILKDVETAYRGYVIARDPSYLQPFEAAVVELRTDEPVLRQRGVDAGQNLDALRSLSDAKVAFARSVIEAASQPGDGAEQLIKSGQGKRMMDEARALSSGMQASLRADADRISTRRAPIAMAFGVLSLAGLLFAAALLLRAAAAARKLSEQVQKLFGAVMVRAPVGLALVTKSGVITQSNPAFSALVGAKEPVEGKRLGVVSAPVAEVVLPGIRGVEREGQAVATERQEAIEIVTDGQVNFVSTTIFPLGLEESDETGSAVGILLKDTTKQREWELAIEEERDRADAANRAKSAFIANMSHELRTPVTAVLGYCELLEDEVADLGAEGEDLLPDLRKIGINARHLLGLINDVLDLSKIEAQKMEIFPVDAPLGRLLEEVSASIGSLVEKNGNVFEMINHAGDVVLHTDDLKLKQILLNLIGNAAKFTKNGTIRLIVDHELREGVGFTTMRVTDTGIGMSPDQVANLFQRFNQADQSTTRKYGGTGLGLALTKAIATMLGGDIRVDSEEGKGSTFSFSIPDIYVGAPVDESEISTLVTGAAKPAANASSGGPRILVVDDEAAAREFLTRVLTREGFEVITANDGRSGVDLARKLKPKAILLDVMMPGVDGWRALRELRDDAATADIPVIIQTVLDEENFAYALGASGFLQKPISRGDLVEAMHDVMSVNGDHILVVDDDRDAVDRTASLLEKDGWRVARAYDGRQAIAELERDAPAVVLVDLIMPGMDGYALIRAIRENPQWANIPVVVLTADDVSSDRVRRLATSTSEIVQKGGKPIADLVADLRRFTVPEKPEA